MPIVVVCLLGCSASPSQPVSGLDAATEDLPSVVEVGLDVSTTEVTVGETGAACAAVFAGCSAFVDATAPGADRTVHFQDYSYDPKCLMVRVGQTVTFAGDFIRHPLTPSCGPELVLENRDTQPAASFVLPSVGLYGYYCLDHGNPQGDVMSGAIEVIP